MPTHVPKTTEILRHMGKRVSAEKAILCPLCSEETQNFEQPMCSTGGMEEMLFCPHCDMTVELVFRDGGMYREQLEATCQENLDT